jgi:hypothetical protein
MNLAVLLGFCLISLGSLSSGWSPPQVRASGARFAQHPYPITASILRAIQSPGSATPSPTPAPPAQSPGATPVSPTPTGETPNSPAQAQPSPAPHRHRKKATPNCSNDPTPLNSASGKLAGSSGSDSTSANSANGLKPCPPPKKVVRNGGSDDPAVQLTGDTTAEQASHKRSSTEQLTAATEENLKKAAGLQLNASQQEMASQIKQFMAQSKAALGAGDLERGHNLAMKAHLLSDELVKP